MAKFYLVNRSIQPVYLRTEEGGLVRELERGELVLLSDALPNLFKDDIYYEVGDDLAVDD